MHNVLHLGGKILADSGGSAHTYELSKEVESIDVFISHNWSVTRWKKFMVLAYYFNLRRAAIFCVILAVIGCVLTALGVFPETRNPQDAGVIDGINRGLFDSEGYWGQILFVPIFLFVLCFGHEIRWLTSCTAWTTFLDKTCIHQTDAALKKQGIIKLGAFLSLSQRMVICYTDVYLRKLWTVYEIACFLTMHPLRNMTIIPVNWALTSVFGVFVLYLNNLRNFLDVPTSMSCAIMYAIGLAFGFSMRFLFNDLRQAQERIRTFSVQDAKCFCEDDRPLVHHNIVLLLKFHHVIEFNTPMTEALEVFNSMVRQCLPQALEASMGSSGMPYRFSFAMVLPIACSLLMDREANMLKAWLLSSVDGVFNRKACLLTCLDASDMFAVLPSMIQTAAWLMTACPDLRGFYEKAYVACGIFVSGSIMVSINMVLGHQVILSRAIDSDAWLAAFVLYIVLWILYTVFLYNGRKQPIKNPNTKVLRRSHISFFSQSGMTFELEEQEGFKISKKETSEEDGLGVSDDKLCGYDTESALPSEENEKFAEVMLMVDEALEDDDCFEAIRLEFSPHVASERDPVCTPGPPANFSQDAVEVRSLEADTADRIASVPEEGPPVFSKTSEHSTEVDLDDFKVFLGVPRRFKPDGPSRQANCTDAVCCY